MGAEPSHEDPNSPQMDWVPEASQDTIRKLRVRLTESSQPKRHSRNLRLLIIPYYKYKQFTHPLKMTQNAY